MSERHDQTPELPPPRVKVLLEEAFALLGFDAGPYNVQLRLHDGNLVKIYATRELGVSSLRQFDPPATPQ
jgi:hypothetical protein